MCCKVAVTIKATPHQRLIFVLHACCPHTHLLLLLPSACSLLGEPLSTCHAGCVVLAGASRTQWAVASHEGFADRSVRTHVGMEVRAVDVVAGTLWM